MAGGAIPLDSPSFGVCHHSLFVVINVLPMAGSASGIEGKVDGDGDGDVQPMIVKASIGGFALTCGGHPIAFMTNSDITMAMMNACIVDSSPLDWLCADPVLSLRYEVKNSQVGSLADALLTSPAGAKAAMAKVRPRVSSLSLLEGSGGATGAGGASGALPFLETRQFETFNGVVTIQASPTLKLVVETKPLPDMSRRVMSELLKGLG